MKQKITLLILTYFKFFAKLQLLKNSPLVIGITGSAGKTSARDTLHALLKEKRKVKISHKANSETGIPLNILGLSPKNFSTIDWLRLIIMCPIKLITNWEKYDVCVVEMGIDSPLPPKNMEYLLTILKPNIGIILNAAPMHSEPFDFLVKTNDPNKRSQELTELIAKEKGKIVTELKKADTAIINSDQKEILSLKDSTEAHILLFGKNTQSNVLITSYSVNLDGTTFKFKHKNESATIKIKNQLLAKHFGSTFAAAICVGTVLETSLKESCQLIEKNFKLPAGRSSLIKGINNSLIIDSSYNSSKKPLVDMLELINSLDTKRKIALLGDIRELGKVGRLEHEAIAKKAAETCDLVLLVGPLMEKFAFPIIKQANTQVKIFKNACEAANFLKNELKENNLLLVKGSQNTLLLEIAVEKLMKNPRNAEKLLARRGEYWNKKRSEIC